MLAAPRPSRLLLAYIITGFAFSAGLGVVVVILLSGWTGPEAPDEVRSQVHYVAQRPAGFGAAREVCEFILRHRQAP